MVRSKSALAIYFGAVLSISTRTQQRPRCRVSEPSSHCIIKMTTRHSPTQEFESLDRASGSAATLGHLGPLIAKPHSVRSRVQGHTSGAITPKELLAALTHVYGHQCTLCCARHESSSWPCPPTSSNAWSRRTLLSPLPARFGNVGDAPPAARPSAPLHRPSGTAQSSLASDTYTHTHRHARRWKKSNLGMSAR